MRATLVELGMLQEGRPGLILSCPVEVCREAAPLINREVDLAPAGEADALRAELARVQAERDEAFADVQLATDGRCVSCEAHHEHAEAWKARAEKAERERDEAQANNLTSALLQAQYLERAEMAEARERVLREAVRAFIDSDDEDRAEEFDRLEEALASMKGGGT